MQSPFTFGKYGQSGVEISSLFPKLTRVADDLCVVRSMHTNVPNHEPSLLMASGEALANCPGRRWAPGCSTASAPRIRTCPASWSVPAMESSTSSNG